MTTKYPQHLQATHDIPPIEQRERGVQPTYPITMSDGVRNFHTDGSRSLSSTAGPRSKKDSEILEGWRNDPRMVFLANPGRDLTAKERAEWERNITQYQIYC